VLTTEGNDLHLNTSEDQVVTELVGSDSHSTLEGLLELFDAKVRHSNVLHFASAL
jgi:hypothetical protein